MGALHDPVAAGHVPARAVDDGAGGLDRRRRRGGGRTRHGDEQDRGQQGCPGPSAFDHNKSLLFRRRPWSRGLGRCAAQPPGITAGASLRRVVVLVGLHDRVVGVGDGRGMDRLSLGSHVDVGGEGGGLTVGHPGAGAGDLVDRVLLDLAGPVRRRAHRDVERNDANREAGLHHDTGHRVGTVVLHGEHPVTLGARGTAGSAGVGDAEVDIGEDSRRHRPAVVGLVTLGDRVGRVDGRHVGDRRRVGVVEHVTVAGRPDLDRDRPGASAAGERASDTVDRAAGLVAGEPSGCRHRCRWPTRRSHRREGGR